jgi:hypothetical protein
VVALVDDAAVVGKEDSVANAGSFGDELDEVLAGYRFAGDSDVGKPREVVRAGIPSGATQARSFPAPFELLTPPSVYVC